MVLCLVTAPSGRSFSVNRAYITQTDEPIDYNMDEASPNSSSSSNKTRKGTKSS